MRKVLDYKIVSSVAREGIQAQVLALIAEGWSLQGGASLDPRGHYMQALVKYEPVKHYVEV